jgi:hypothetical protein
MRLSNVDKSKKTASFRAGNEEELELLSESLDLLLDKRRLAVVEEKNDPLEVKRLVRAQKTKMRTVDLDKVKKIKEDKDKKRRLGLLPDGQEQEEEFIPMEQQQVNVQDIFVIADAINERVAAIEKDGSFHNVNAEKYQKLKKMLDDTDKLKTVFERETPKPQGFGRLRK